MRYHEVPDMWLNLGSDGPSPSRPVLSLGARWGKDAGRSCRGFSMFRSLISFIIEALYRSKLRTDTVLRCVARPIRPITPTNDSAFKSITMRGFKRSFLTSCARCQRWCNLGMSCHDRRPTVRSGARIP